MILETDPLQPLRCFALRPLRCLAAADGLALAAAAERQPADSPLLAGWTCWASSLCMVDGPQRGHGLQPPGRPAARRRESAHAVAASSGRHAERRERGAIYAVVCCAGIRGGTLLFLPRTRLPLYASGAGAAVSVWLQLCQAVYGAGPFLARGGADAGAGVGLDRPARPRWRPIRPSAAGRRVGRRRCCFGWPGFDIIYACQDFEFDVARGCAACRPGSACAGALRLAALCHLGMVVLLAAAAGGFSRCSALDLLARRGWRSPRCWSTSTGWFGPTT